MKKRILFLHHGTGVGGAPISMIKTIKALDADLFVAEVLLLKDSVVKQMLIQEGIKVSVADDIFYKRWYNFFPHIEPAYFKFWQIRSFILSLLFWILSRYYFADRLLSKYSYDLLHLNSSVLSDFLCSGSKRGKVIMHIREPMANGYFGFRKSIIKNQIALYADHVIAISKDNAARLGLIDKVSVVYNFSEVNENPINVRDVAGKVVLYVGGDSIIKGFLTLVDSLPYLDEDIEVWFCGYYKDGNKNSISMLEKLKDAIRELMPMHKKLLRARNVILTHPRAKVLGLRNDVSVLMTKSTVLVSPFSIEHFSRPVVEAFSNARCAIGTDVVGMDEIIDNEVNGLIVKNNDPVALAAAINRVCDDINFNERMAKQAYAKAQVKFTSSNVVEICNIYKNILMI